jgi:carboxypeptidase C (cathepsin A)
LAAMAAWEVLQGFYSALPKLDSRVKSTSFNLFTESYGGHYGPAFFNYFYEQNAAIANGTSKGKFFDFNALGIVSTSICSFILSFSKLKARQLTKHHRSTVSLMSQSKHLTIRSWPITIPTVLKLSMTQFGAT